jgi:hypothetical protein
VKDRDLFWALGPGFIEIYWLIRDLFCLYNVLRLHRQVPGRAGWWPGGRGERDHLALLPPPLPCHFRAPAFLSAPGAGACWAAVGACSELPHNPVPHPFAPPHPLGSCRVAFGSGGTILTLLALNLTPKGSTIWRAGQRRQTRNKATTAHSTTNTD